MREGWSFDACRKFIEFTFLVSGNQIGVILKIRRIHLRKDDLLKMADRERAFVLLAGHILNELNSLHKVFAWCLQNPTPDHVQTIESLAAGAQAMIYARILAGKLFEANAALGKAYFGTKISQRIEPKLLPEALIALKMVNAYFGKANAIFKVRNHFSFHYTIEEFNNHWDAASNEENFEIILGGIVGNNMHLAAEIVVNTALLNGINPIDKSEALRIFLNDVQSVASHFIVFLEGVILALLEEQLGPSYFETLWQEEEIFPMKNFSDVAIPFFFQPNADV